MDNCSVLEKPSTDKASAAVTITVPMEDGRNLVIMVGPDTPPRYEIEERRDKRV